VADVRLIDVTRRYGAVVALDRLSLDIAEGEFVSLLGPSGCGKTTTLRIIAGLIPPTSGSVVIGGEPMAEVPVHRRNLGMVFQQYALFPHMTVAENVAFGLEARALGRPDVAARVREALALVKLTGKEDRYPRQLSGGQQQRVGLARAIAVKPRVLLLDEPFGALDRKLRLEMQAELRELQRRLGITAVFVTHDQEEALSLSDRIAVMNEGRLEQLGTPIEVYERPETPFVADFMGMANQLEATVTGAEGDRIQAVTRGGLPLALPGAGPPHRPGARLLLTVRPEKIELDAGLPAPGAPEHARRNVARGKVAAFTYRGDATHYEVRLDGGETLTVVQQNARTLAGAVPFGPGEAVTLAWDVEATRALRG
jgi:spermidine/putrescine ABC transporter ATP-binding subunit